jgi:hypothetical protein
MDAYLKKVINRTDMNPKSQNPAMFALVSGISEQSDAGVHLHEWHTRRFFSW